MKRRSFLSALLWTCWIPVLTAAVAVCFQALRVTGKKTEYYALGRIVAGMKTAASEGGEMIENSGVAKDFYGTQIETIESGALRTRSLERVRALHPELKEIDVEVRVTQTKGSAILNVAAVGEEPKYTRIYLDALLDEYIAFGKEMTDKSVGTSMNKIIEEVLAHEKALKEARGALAAFEKKNDPSLLSAEHARRVKEVSALRGELEELKRSGPDEAKMKALMEHLADADKGREAVWENAGTHLTLQKTAEDAEKSLAVWKQTMEKLDRESVPREFVAIMERPNAAVEQEPELWRPLILFGLGGFVIGLFLMFLIAGLVAFASKGVGTSPPPLS